MNKHAIVEVDVMPEYLTVKQLFSEAYKNQFLDVWYEIAPGVYDKAHEECEADGNEMIQWLYDTTPGLAEKVSIITMNRWDNKPIMSIKETPPRPKRPKRRR